MDLRNVSAIKSFAIFATTHHVISCGKNCETFCDTSIFHWTFFLLFDIGKKKKKEKVSLILVKWNKVKSKILVKWDFFFFFGETAIWDLVGNRESEKGGQSTLQENIGYRHICHQFFNLSHYLSGIFNLLLWLHANFIWCGPQIKHS